MTQSLEQYVAEATNAYKPASTAIQSQIDALQGNLETTNQNINRNYAQQQYNLDRARNQAASSASMQAAGSGGSFGGAANIANKKYYDQSFVPAVTQMHTNQANDLATARQNYEDTKTNLNSQLASLEAQANQQALAQYYSDREAEATRALQAQQIAAQNAYYQYLMDAAKAQNSKYSLSGSRNMYGGFDWTDAQGNKHTVSTVAAAAAGSNEGTKFNESLYDALQMASNQGDYYSQVVANEISNGARFAKNTSGNSTGNHMYDTLGIYRVN